MLKWRWLEKVGQAFRFSYSWKRMSCSRRSCTLKNGHHLRFWTDRWIQGVSVAQVVLALLQFVWPAVLRRLVLDALLT